MDELDCLEADTGPAPATTVIVLHGLGADGDDFLPITHQLDLSALGPVRWVFPRAPVIPVTVNGGWRMRAWYDIVGGADLTRREDEAGVRASREAIDALLRREQARGVDSRRMVLAGFSQGCAMALMTGLRHASPLAGIAGLSGYLPLAACTAAERHAANAATPVFLAHGTHDDIVPLARGAASRDALAALGQPVRWRDYPIAHSVSPQELQDLRAWLLDVLAPA